ncbi:MAG: NADH-quinone oxidoreductase subunit NuoK [Desulfonauticus sp.]|nr:NADH-quinone oxidoreductase subunit NuoK [Desulfonauticus sp.]
MNYLLIYHLVALFLMCMGLIGVVWRRTFVGILISIELLLNGAGLAIMASAKLTPTADFLGQAGTLVVMGLAAAEATIFLALVLVVFRRFGRIIVKNTNLLRG